MISSHLKPVLQEHLLLVALDGEQSTEKENQPLEATQGRVKSPARTGFLTSSNLSFSSLPI